MPDGELSIYASDPVFVIGSHYTNNVRDGERLKHNFGKVHIERVHTCMSSYGRSPVFFWPIGHATWADFQILLTSRIIVLL